MHPWAHTADEVLSHYKVDPKMGLSGSEAIKRQEEHGFNELHKDPKTPLWKLVLEQFDDMLVKVIHPFQLLHKGN